jgi:hypothetical protein
MTDVQTDARALDAQLREAVRRNDRETILRLAAYANGLPGTTPPLLDAIQALAWDRPEDRDYSAVAALLDAGASPALVEPASAEFDSVTLNRINFMLSMRGKPELHGHDYDGPYRYGAAPGPECYYDLLRQELNLVPQSAQPQNTKASEAGAETPTPTIEPGQLAL